MKVPDELKHPSGGEYVDDLALNAVKLAHDAIERFPDMKRKHMFLAGGAAISSALIVAAGVAVMRRVRAGAKPEEAVQAVTEDEIEGLRLVERTHYRPNGHSEASTTDDLPAAPVGATSAPNSGSAEAEGSEGTTEEPGATAAGL